MTSAVELKRQEEQKKLMGAQSKIRTVLEKEPFGMTLAQLTGMCRFSMKYTKEVLKAMDDVQDEGGYFKLKPIAAAPVVLADEKKAKEVDVEALKPVYPGKIIPAPEAKVLEKPEKKASIAELKMTDQVLELLKTDTENGVLREQIRNALGLTPKQLANTVLRLRQRHHVVLVGEYYRLVEGEPMPVSEQVKARNAYFNLFSDVKSKIVTRTERKAVLSRDEVNDILSTVFGLNDVKWTDEGVVLSQVDEVA